MNIWALLAGKEAAAATEWWAILTSLGALIAAAAAVIALVVDGHRRRRQLGIDNMWRLVERWDQPLLRSIRARAARSLLDDFDSRQELPPDATEVLNLFELLGYLVVRSKTLPVQDAWVNFSAHVLSWWDACRPAIEIERDRDPTVYEEVARLAEEFRAYEKKRGLEPWQSSEDDLRIFLEGEASLVETERQKPGPRFLGRLRRD